MQNFIKVGVGVYIFNDKNQILLGFRNSKHGNGSWAPPGGHIEFGETPEQAIIREVKEETNLTLNPLDIEFKDFTNDFFEKTYVHYITLHFFCKKFTGSPLIMEPDKCLKWEWFDITNLPENLFLPNQNFLKKYTLKNIDKS